MADRHCERAPLWCVLVSWGVLLLLIQQAERVFLTPEVTAANPATVALLVKTFAFGLVNDAAVAIGGLAVSIALAGLLISLQALLRSREGITKVVDTYRRSLTVVSILIAFGLLAVSTADLAYYAHNHQHLDFVFFEYIDELFHAVTQGATSQAAAQTDAELEDPTKWILRIGGFWGLTTLFVALWRLTLRRLQHSAIGPWRRPKASIGMVLLLVVAGGAAVGLGPLTSPLTDLWRIDSEAYYSLSQNPILFARHSLRDAFLSQWIWAPSTLPQPMTEAEAVDTARLAIGEGRSFPFSNYPFVSELLEAQSPHFDRPANVLLIFVEGLDRRYLGRIHRVSDSTASAPAAGTFLNVRLTPFLDHFKEDSLYFSHFFSNGVQTARGLFSTLCSALPRQGTAVIKTRYTHDFLCLPSLLKKAGYRTEMVASLDSDLSGLRSFLQQNGIDRYYGDQDFSEATEHAGVGLTDGALLDVLESRIEALQSAHNPFFLTTLTSGMHHPFWVPSDHPDVQALQTDPDKYLAALRYFDLKVERFFTRLQSRGLLNNTMVLVLGDHGRHEPVGDSDLARQTGHFMAPLFIWLDDSLRATYDFQPRSMEQVVSQVDVTPTILAMNGLTPHFAPFVGQDVSCLWSGKCLTHHRAYLSSVYDDLIGLADETGIWLYSFRRDSLTHTDLDTSERNTHPAGQVPKADQYARLMSALYLSFNFAIERNRLWSWPALADKL